MTAGLRGAVIGCGRMGAFTSQSVREYGPAFFLPSAHAEAIAIAEGLELDALCDPDENALLPAGRQYGAERLYPSLEALLAQRAPDLVGLATRTPGRAAMIRDCIAAGTRALHVEKPLCSSFEELARLESAFARPDVFVTLGAVRRHLGVYQRALEQARSGVYGALLASHGEFGVRALYWSHPHTVDLLLFAAQGAPVEAVQARLGPVERDGARILNDPLVHHASVWFEGGHSGQITSMPGNDWRLACESAQIAVVANGSSLWRSGRAQNAPETNPYHEPKRIDSLAITRPEGALSPIRHLIACLHGDRAAITANAAIKRDIITGQKTLFAMVQSHLEGGRPVRLDEIDPKMVIEARTKGVPA